tara:strand:+ start:368 stop:487 length:120 start_codon:yes stop_codon:yes gene_type:complete
MIVKSKGFNDSLLVRVVFEGTNVPELFFRHLTGDPERAN